MDDILPSMEDLTKQRLADIHIQIQALKQEQNRIGNNKDLFNICQQKEQVFEDIINLVYQFGDTYEYL